jgi:hypothetical protein
VIEDLMLEQAGCFENTRDFPGEEIPLGYRLRSPLSIEEIASSLRSSQRPLSLSHGFLNHPACSIYFHEFGNACCGAIKLENKMIKDKNGEENGL